jgi:hypothetical protein
MIKRNEELVTIPVYMFEKLLSAYYFEKACRYYNVESWSAYEDSMKYMTQLAVSDIMKDNKE